VKWTAQPCRHEDAPLKGAAYSAIGRVMPPALAALAAVGIGRLVPLLGPMLVAIVIGAVVANTRLATSPMLAGQGAVTRLLLRLGVVLLGLRLPLGEIAAIGVRGVVVIILTVMTTYWLSTVIGARMQLDRRFVTLMAAGFSICGAAAIAAVNDAVRARERDVALAIGLVTLFGAAMIVAVPWLSGAMSLSGDEAAIWAGASIHEVAQVVATASLLGSSAIAVATIIKLGRVALLAPTYMLAARGAAHAGLPVPLVPWFLTGFAAMVVLRSADILPAVALSVAEMATVLLLTAAMFGLGLGLRLRELWPIPTQALALASFSTVIAAGTSLALIALMY
jgi:uncharacterized integral membrane protein (TIGR00698 family)